MIIQSQKYKLKSIDADYKIGGLELEEFIKEYDKTLMTSFKNINVELAANKTSKSTLAFKGRKPEELR